MIHPEASLQEVIRVIDRGAANIALVTNSQQKLLGVITDGDIRRAILENKSLDSSAEHIMQRDFRSLPDSSSEEQALMIMHREILHQIPVLDNQGRVVQLFLLKELTKSKVHENPVIIMAGGEGKRLRPLTHDCPKPMLQLQGKPILEILLEQCIRAGFNNYYFAVNYLKHQIIDYFNNGASWGVYIDYLEEKRPLGTAGALSLLPEIPDKPLLVLNGDVLSGINYDQMLRFHEEHYAVATLCVREHVTQIPYGVVNMDDLHVLSLEEKPVLSHFVNAGIYLLDPKVLKLISKNQFLDMPQLLEQVVQKQQRVSAFPIHEYWLDLGHPENLERAKSEWI